MQTRTHTHKNTHTHTLSLCLSLSHTQTPMIWFDRCAGPAGVSERIFLGFAPPTSRQIPNVVPTGSLALLSTPPPSRSHFFERGDNCAHVWENIIYVCTYICTVCEWMDKRAERSVMFVYHVCVHVYKRTYIYKRIISMYVWMDKRAEGSVMFVYHVCVHVYKRTYIYIYKS